MKSTQVNTPLVDKILKVPVVLLGSVPIHRSVPRALRRPVTAPLRIFVHGIEARIQIPLPKSEGVVRLRLNKPLSSEHRELAIPSLHPRVRV